MSTMIAKRDVEIVRDDEKITGSIQVFAPVFHEKDEKGAGFWKCDFSFDFGDEQHTHYAGGVDAYQALQMALQILPVRISTTKSYRSGQLHLWDEPMSSNIQTFGFRPLGDV